MCLQERDVCDGVHDVIRALSFYSSSSNIETTIDDISLIKALDILHDIADIT